MMLVGRLRRGGHCFAEVYAKKVQECTDSTALSRLIAEMGWDLVEVNG